tara:strand:- start:2365 stop:2703 length:339 start_codon:yes stop_codon:yes gene_type:complete
MSNNISWDSVLTPSGGEVVSLREVPLDQEVAFTFASLTQTSQGYIVASVETEVSGDTLWLKGSRGPQNGLLSLMKAAEGGENIEGNTFMFSRVASEKSPAGYAFRWFKADEA